MVARCATIVQAAEIVAPVVAAGEEAFAATATTVWLLRPDRLALIPAHGTPSATPLPLEPGTPQARTVAEQVVVVHQAAGAAAGAVTTCAFTPLLADERTLGVVAFGFADVRQLDTDELELMGTLGRQAGQALERARLNEEAAQRARQSAFLAAMSGELDKVAGFAERARRLVELVVPGLAAYAKIEVPDAPGAEWFAAAAPAEPTTTGTATPPTGTGTQPEGSDCEPWPEPGAARAALAAAVQTGHPQTLPAPAGSQRLTMVLPLRARGRVLGALLMVVGANSQTGTDRGFLDDLADRAGLALENARLSEQDREVASTLQRSLLAADPPVDARFAVVAAYQSGVESLEVGGDWHDTFATAEDRVGVVVGDVVGRGIRAASAMGQLRSAVRALALAGFGPSTVLGHVDNFVATLESAQMATVAFAELALDTGELRYACAGHPPPLLLPPDGEPQYLWGGRSGPVGSFASLPAREESGLTMPRGSRLMLYTDGLIERRGESIHQGLSRLSTEAAERRHTSLEDLVDGLSKVMLTGVRSRDDMCLLALEYCDVPVFRRRLGADAAHLTALRAELRQWLSDNAFADPEQYGIVLACSEAVANAIEHGYGSDPTGMVTINATLGRRMLEIRVSDLGTWRPPGGRGDRGRGMGLMARTMDEMTVDRGRGTTIIMRRRIRKAAG